MVELEHLVHGLELEGLFYSSYLSTVRDNKDPEKRGRIQIDCPQLFGDQHYDIWVLPKGIPNGKEQGMFWVPAKGDSVWLSFEKGDLRFPMWQHGYWGENASLNDLYDSSGEPSGIIFQDLNGHRFVMNKNAISLVSDKISLGTLDKSKEAGVLGDTLVKLLKELNQLIEQLTVNTAMGPSSIPVNVQDFINLEQKYKDALSQVVTLD